MYFKTQSFLFKHIITTEWNNTKILQCTNTHTHREKDHIFLHKRKLKMECYHGPEIQSMLTLYSNISTQTTCSNSLRVQINKQIVIIWVSTIRGSMLKVLQKRKTMSKEWGEQVEGDNWSSLKRQMRKEVIGR